MKFAFSNFEVVIISPAGVRTVGLDHPFYMEICRALQSGNDKDVITLLDAKAAIAKPFEKLSAVVEVKETLVGDPDIYVDGLKISPRVADLILKCKQRGIPFQALKKFWAKVQKNPLLVGKESMLDFITKNNVPLLPNGNFLAYKGVNSTAAPDEFTSVHDASFIYKLGTIATLPLSECTSDVNNACGAGLHVGGFKHASGYGNVMLDCEVDPSDVVSVPVHEHCKLRACKVLPMRVNKDRTHYTQDYILIQNGDVVQGVAKPPKNQCPDKNAGGRNKKTTWYKKSGGLVMVQRKVVSPGAGWTSTKPTVKASGSKAVSKPVGKLSLPGAQGMRTWYKRLPKGLLATLRAVRKPVGYSSHKPA